MFRRLVILTAIAISLVGCAHPPPPEEMAKADYGPYPDNYIETVKNYLGGVLKDPSSVEYRDFTIPRKYWMGGISGAPVYGYMTCVIYNAKNSYGGYVGYQTDLFLIRNGVVARFLEKADNFMGQNLCTA